MKLVFATANKNKINEVLPLIPASIDVLSLVDIGCSEEIPETHGTIEANSQEKAEYIFQKYGYNCFSEDSGLEIEALDGEPGVYSAHYAGTRDAAQNINLVLLNMRGITNRRAQFKTVFTLIVEGNINQFTGIVTGFITDAPKGNGGFGYDPIFVPDGSVRTFAEFTQAEKSAVSHRSKAFGLLTSFINNNL